MKRLVVFLAILLVLPIVYSEELNIPETFKSSNTQVTSYFYSGNNLIATKDSTSVKYYSQDRLGSNRLTTNNLGAKVGETKTLPFGEEILNTADNKFTFTGKELDSNLYYFGARYYDSNLGRFTSVDPIGTNYNYVDNNPMNYIDPSGAEKKILSPVDIPIWSEDSNIYIHAKELGITMLYGSTLHVRDDKGKLLYSHALNIKEATPTYWIDVVNGKREVSASKSYQQDESVYGYASFNFNQIFGGHDETIRLDYAQFLDAHLNDLRQKVKSEKFYATCSGFAFYLLTQFAKENGLVMLIKNSDGEIARIDPKNVVSSDYDTGMFSNVNILLQNVNNPPFSDIIDSMSGDMFIKPSHAVVLFNPSFNYPDPVPVLYDPVQIPESEPNPTNTGNYA